MRVRLFTVLSGLPDVEAIILTSAICCIKMTLALKTVSA